MYLAILFEAFNSKHEVHYPSDPLWEKDMTLPGHSVFIPEDVEVARTVYER